MIIEQGKLNKKEEILVVYDKENNVVIESTEKIVTMPDTSDSAVINSGGESDGTRSL